MKWGIIWFLRWLMLPSPPILIITAVLFMVPGFWQYIASMWLSKRGRRIFNRWWVRIPPLGIGLMMIGWAVNVLSHLLSYFPPCIIRTGFARSFLLYSFILSTILSLCVGKK